MKLVIKIALVVCAVIVIGIIIMISTVVIGFKFLFSFSVPPDPPKPEITYGEFNFELTYEVNGKTYTVNDVLVYEYAGFNVDFWFQKTRQWKDHYKGESENGWLVIHQIDDTYSIRLCHTNVEWYFMSDPSTKYTTPNNSREDYKPDEPIISVFNSNTKRYENDSAKNEILENCGFKIIHWYCDPPIKNSFK